MGEGDGYDYGRSSLQSLKAFEWLSLDHCSSDEPPGSVVRIPASHFPTPSFQASKEERCKTKRPPIHGSNICPPVTSALRLHPHAASSSPDSDGSRTQIRRELLSPLKSHNSCHRHTRCKIFPGSENAEMAARKHSMKNKAARGRAIPADDGQPQEKNHQH